MRVFLTGGTGFLGSYVAGELVARGHVVAALVRPASRPGVLATLPGVEMVPGTLDDPGALAPVVARCDAVVHVAGIVKAARPDDFFRVNERGTRALAEALAEARPGAPFVLVSSMAAQGPCDGPRERDPALPEAPVSLYGRSKLAGERAVLAFGDRLAATILRPAMIYGPRDYEFLKVFQFAARTGRVFSMCTEQVACVVDVRDCARAVAMCVDVPHATPAVYPIDDGTTPTWHDVAAVVGRVLDRPVKAMGVPRSVMNAVAVAWEGIGRLTGSPPIVNRDKVREAAERYWVCGHSALKAGVGWTPQVAMEDGFRAQVAWARSEGLL